MVSKSRVATHDPAVEVAAYKVAADDRKVERNNFPEVLAPVGERGTGVEECIRNTVGESANNEERYTEEERQHVIFASKGNGGGHNETTGCGQDAAIDDAEL